MEHSIFSTVGKQLADISLFPIRNSFGFLRRMSMPVQLSKTQAVIFRRAVELGHRQSASSSTVVGLHVSPDI